MLSSKLRLVWIKWHAYLSCFFLPFALLYAITGLLYLLDFTGNKTTVQTVFIESQVALPETEASALNLYKTFLKSHPELPAERPERFWQDDHMVTWWDVHGEILLIPESNDAGKIGYKVVVDEFDFLMHLHSIHKGLAGIVFKVLGLLMGLSLLISIITGAVIALSVPNLKYWSVRAVAAGSLVLIVAFLVS